MAAIGRFGAEEEQVLAGGVFEKDEDGDFVGEGRRHVADELNGCDQFERGGHPKRHNAFQPRTVPAGLGVSSVVRIEPRIRPFALAGVAG